MNQGPITVSMRAPRLTKARVVLTPNTSVILGEDAITLVREETLAVGPFGADLEGWWVTGVVMGVEADPMWVSAKTIHQLVDAGAVVWP